MPAITALYAGLLGLLSLAVAYPAGSLRGKLNISVGDGGNPQLCLAMRRHANFAEWVPLALLLIGLLEMNGTRHTAIHALGAALVVSRVCHAFGLKVDNMKSPARFVGATGTALIVAVSSVWCIVKFVV